ncbi:MAG: bifunctional ADP-heptose synthase [bacterium]|nr:bifunctional ADP-heptose synthase [bacterium]
MAISLQRAKEITSLFAEKNILVVGDIVLDTYIYGNVERLNPEAPVPILHAKKEKNATGGAGNTAKNAAMLGAKVTCIGVVGNDDSADLIDQSASNEGYIPVLVRSKSAQTIVKKRYVVGSQQLLRVDFEELIELSSDIEDRLLEEIKVHAASADAIIVSDYAKGTISEKVAHALMDAMRAHNIPLMADVKPSRISYFTGATYISPNKKEAHEYLGINQHENGGKKAHELAEMLTASFDTTVFITLGGEGMFVQAKKAQGEYVPTVYIEAGEVVDTSGCGDTAAVNILLATLVGATLTEAAEIGNAAGATVAKKTGAVGITQGELLHTIAEHHA